MLFRCGIRSPIKPKYLSIHAYAFSLFVAGCFFPLLPCSIELTYNTIVCMYMRILCLLCNGSCWHHTYVIQNLHLHYMCIRCTLLPLSPIMCVPKYYKLTWPLQSDCQIFVVRFSDISKTLHHASLHTSIPEIWNLVTGWRLLIPW